MVPCFPAILQASAISTKPRNLTKATFELSVKWSGTPFIAYPTLSLPPSNVGVERKEGFRVSYLQLGREFDYATEKVVL